MLDTTRTTTVLLAGLFDAGNDAVWQEFDARYRPILLAFARRLGLRDTDAADVAQETLLQFVREYRAGRYDRERGRLRSWILTIARTRAAGVYRARAVKREARGASAFVDLEDEQALSRIWDGERRAVILREALDELKATTRASDKTVKAFELFAVRQMPADEIAAELGMSRHDVYLAKSRMAGRLREIIARLESVYDEDAA